MTSFYILANYSSSGVSPVGDTPPSSTVVNNDSGWCFCLTSTLCFWTNTHLSNIERHIHFVKPSSAMNGQRISALVQSYLISLRHLSTLRCHSLLAFFRAGHEGLWTKLMASPIIALSPSVDQIYLGDKHEKKALV